MLPPSIVSADSGLSRIAIDLPPLSSSIWLVMHADVRSNARVRAFADFAYDRLRANAELFGER